ncbi:MAG: SGNH/GDSL hydrolase family protein [Lentisphaeria bacterium]
MSLGICNLKEETSMPSILRINSRLFKAAAPALCALVIGVGWGCQNEDGRMKDNDVEPLKNKQLNSITMENLDGVRGKVFRIAPEEQSFQLLKETAFDPKTNEGKSRHTVYWTDRTRFVKVKRQSNFKGLAGEYLAHFRNLNDKNATAVAAGRDFVVKHVTILAADEEGGGLKKDDHNFVAPFKLDPASDGLRDGTVMIDDKSVRLHLGGGNRAQVDIRTVSSAAELSEGFWETTLHGARRGDGRFMVESMEMYPRIDPREVDDPSLPRILIVGDSISMNYHKAAKQALEGVANYHRIDGNGGDTERGVVCMELWLGDYTQPGLQWDVIQFNHGLHDLKQVYDEETGEYGAYQVPIDEYKSNLEKEIQIMEKTGATLVWCTTTPVPNDYFGHWANGTFGRRSAAVALYNQAAREVIEKYPEIKINDLNRFINESEAFDQWRQQKDVHFWDGKLQQLVGQAVADKLTEAITARKD